MKAPSIFFVVTFLTLFISFVYSTCPKGVEEVQCLVDPCVIRNCKGCISDYCGGCNAYCECSSDGDCLEHDEWCKPDHSPATTSHCSRYVTEGMCGGYVLPSFARRCRPESHTCVYLPSRMTDVPGKCFKNCENTASCNGQNAHNNNNNNNNNYYCTKHSKVCVPMGECTSVADCLDSENAFVMPKCIGTTSCHYGQCRHDCGIKSCSSAAECPVEYSCKNKQCVYEQKN